MKSPLSTDFPPPAQGLVGATYDQSLTVLPQARLRTRRRIEQRRRIAAYARLTMAVAKQRALSDAELRDLLAAQPDDEARGDLLLALYAGGMIGWDFVRRELVRRATERHLVLREAAGAPCDHCGEAFVHEDGCPIAEVAGQPVDAWTRPIAVDGSGTVVSGHHRAELARQLDLPLAATDGRDAP